MSRRPLIYLDVDGVINASKPEWATTDAGMAFVDGMRYWVSWSPDMLEALTALNADFMWATTWRTAAVEVLSQLTGVGSEWPVLHPQLDIAAELVWPSISWKMIAVEMHQRIDPRPFIHIDDEIGGPWRTRVTEMGGLAISPDPAHGISPEEIEQIKNYIEEHTQ